MPNINLIGYRCSGKSSVGRKLAEVLQRSFVDADAVFTEQTTMSITDFVKKSGWPEFRRIESRVLSDLCQKENIVLATGGGAVLNLQNRQILCSNGINFWLQVTPETVLARVVADTVSATQRPSLSSLSRADEISAGLKKRAPFYREVADHTINADKLNIAEIAEQILLQYKKL